MSIFGVLRPCRCTDGGEIWHGGGDFRCHISPPSVQRVSRAGVKNLLSKLNTGRLRFAQCYR